MKYVCFGSSKFSFSILDRENKKYIQVNNGIIVDKTKDCEKMNKSYYKAIQSGKYPDEKMGSKYYDYIIGKNDISHCLILKNEILLETDNRKELDLFIMNCQIEQLQFKMNYIKKCISYVENDKCESNLYTY